MTNLFGEEKKEPLRAICLYQPFCSLMIHGKIETRWVLEGRKPQFKIGAEYLFYSAKKGCDRDTILNWCHDDITDLIDATLIEEKTKDLHGYALFMGTFEKSEPMRKEQEKECFVKWAGEKI